jgi:hypothetical protein
MGKKPDLEELTDIGFVILIKTKEKEPIWLNSGTHVRKKWKKASF